jgi:4-hydroxy-2-oxoheptanedioate aldolase
MRENNIRSIWKRGGAVINGWLGIPSSIAAENMAQAGWDGLTVDLQHGHVDYQVAITMLQAISTTGTTPLARVPWMERIS